MSTGSRFFAGNVEIPRSWRTTRKTIIFLRGRFSTNVITCPLSQEPSTHEPNLRNSVSGQLSALLGLPLDVVGMCHLVGVDSLYWLDNSHYRCHTRMAPPFPGRNLALFADSARWDLFMVACVFSTRSFSRAVGRFERGRVVVGSSLVG